MAAPTGTVTFLLTDIENAARWWLDHPEPMRAALARHNAIMRQAIEHNDGYVFKTAGASFSAAFHTATDALRAALAAQLALGSEEWPTPLNFKVRMSLHTGVADFQDNDYFGRALIRASQVLRLGHGGQILVTTVTQELIIDELPSDCSIQDLGEHLLPDLNRAEQIFQVSHLHLAREFPPLKPLFDQVNDMPAEEALPQRGSVESVSQYDAVQLFIARALLAKPDFEVTVENAPALAEICGRLDRIPLAIELIAARVRSLPIEDINVELDAQFSSHGSENRSTLPQQDTLHAVVDWSFKLLSDQEKRVLQRLSVFAGGFTAELAEQVCAGDGVEEWEVPYIVGALSDKSLVISEKTQGEFHFRLLETVRQYVYVRFEVSAEFAPINFKHRDALIALAERAERNLASSNQQMWLERLEQNRENLRAALTWSLVEDPEAEPGLRLAGALGRFWFAKGHSNEGLEQLGTVLDKVGASTCASPVRAKAILWTGRLVALHDPLLGRSFAEESLRLSKACEDLGGTAQALVSLERAATESGDYEQARSLGEEALQLFRKLGERDGQALALVGLGFAVTHQAEYAVAESLLAEGLGFYRDMGNRRGVAAALNCQGYLAYSQGDFGPAKELYEEALPFAIELGDKERIATISRNLGNVARQLGDFDGARRSLGLCLETSRELRLMFNLAFGLSGFADLLCAEGNLTKATQLWAAAAAIRERCDYGMPANEIEQNKANFANAKLFLRSKAFDSAWAEGVALSWEEAVMHALESAPNVIF